MSQSHYLRRNSPKFRSFPAGKCIFKQGDSGTTMYLVLSGKVELRVDGRVVETVGEGGVVGEMSMIDRAPRAATAVAVDDCTLTPIGQKQFSDLVQRSPDFSMQIMKTIADRLRRMNDRYHHMKAVAADDIGQAALSKSEDSKH